ncbi:MAG: hypothetical protein HXY20_05765 [Acidobacteria bacterium]|nr:hypothetical protein [Acidobacteriota bacterium]
MFRSPVVTTRHLWTGLPLFILLWKCFLFPLPMLDFWWHLKAGEVIVTSRTIPTADIFSFTAEGKPFVLGNWLAEVIYYLLYRLGNLELLLFGNALLVTAAFLAVYSLCWQATDRFRVRIFCAAIAALCFSVGVRTQVFSFFFFALYYWVLWQLHTRRRNLLWILPVLMIFWVNLHGGFFLGLALISIFLCAECANRCLRSNLERLPLKELRQIVFIFLLCLIATGANPQGYHVYTYVWTVASDPSSQKLVIEWQPPSIETARGMLLFFGPFFMTLVALVYSRRRPHPTEVALFVVSAAFAFTAMRNGIWFIILNIPLLARCFPDSLDQRHEKPYFASTTSDDAIRQQTHYTRVMQRPLDVVLACLALFVLALLSPWVHPRVYGGDLLAPETPVRAVDFVQSRGIKGKMFHPQEYGDYLIWRLWPQQRSFIDGRVHLFGEAFVREYQQVFCDSNWEESLARYGIEYLLLKKDPDQAEHQRLLESVRNSGRWIMLYEDNLSILFEKSNPHGMSGVQRQSGTRSQPPP